MFETEAKRLEEETKIAKSDRTDMERQLSTALFSVQQAKKEGADNYNLYVDTKKKYDNFMIMYN